MSIFPFVKVGEDGVVSYRIQLVDADKKLQNTNYSLRFYSQDRDVHENLSAYELPRLNKQRDTSSSYYYKIDKEFDFIQFVISSPNVEATALIIPNWAPYAKTDTEYAFSVDLGVTNTHLAYKKNNNDAPIPFDLSDAVATLFDEKKSELNIKACDADDIITLIDREFVPREIGCDSIFKFPQKTVIAFNECMPSEWRDDGLEALQEGNIPFGYEKMLQKGNTIHTNFGDRKDRIAQHEMNAYLQELVMLMQAKVLIEGGDLKKSRLVWFYTRSMSRRDIDMMERKWQSYFSEYFFKGDRIPDGCLVGIMRSLAQFYAMSNSVAAFDCEGIAFIDIGGGATEVSLFYDAKLKATTSFRFAGNTLFGGHLEKNGFTIKYIKEFEVAIERNRIWQAQSLLKDLKDLKETGRASDVNAFLFSLEDSIEFWNKNIIAKRAYSYTEKISEDYDLKFLILYFYVALLWHISKVLKKLGDESIRYLVFSGETSRILKVLTMPDTLYKYTRKIFAELGLNSDVEVMLVKNPKEIVCDGGLMASTYQEARHAERAAENILYTCIEGREFDQNVTYADCKKNVASVEKELIDFNEFFFKLDEDCDYHFSDYLGISQSVTKWAKDNYANLIKKWLEDSFLNEEIEDSEVSETPFFMPLKSIILDMSERIAKGEIINK